jgi:hypothetical protein
MAICRWVTLISADPLTGRVNADDLQQLHKDELCEQRGRISPADVAGGQRSVVTSFALL